MRMTKKIKFLMVAAVFMAIGGIYAGWKSVKKTEQSRQVMIRKQLKVAEHLIKNQTRHIRPRPQTTRKAALIDVDRGTPDFDELFRHLVVVSAFSENHYKEALGMIASVQTAMPHTRIVVYDIGMKNTTLLKAKSLCNVEVRPFKFKMYPTFVSNLATYSWKVIIIKETLNEFGVIFWADASVRFVQSLRILLPFAHEHHGYLSRIHSYSALTVTPIQHNYYMTVNGTYHALGVDREKYAKSAYAPHPASNRQLILNSTTIQRNYLRPMHACALNKSCISPLGAKHGVNHRFDASALMLVIHKYFPGEFSRENDHIKDIDKVMYMHRAADDWAKAKRCVDDFKPGLVRLPRLFHP